MKAVERVGVRDGAGRGGLGARIGWAGRHGAHCRICLLYTSRQRRALQAFDCVEKRVEIGPAARRNQSLPVREKTRQRALFHWFNFAAKTGERFTANDAQYLGIRCV